MKASERHRLKHDKYAETMVSGLGWAREHLSVIILMLVAVMVVVAGFSYWRYTRNQSIKMAQEELIKLDANSVQVMLLPEEDRLEKAKEIALGYETLAVTYPNTSAASRALFGAAEVLADVGAYEEAAAYYKRALPAVRDERGLAELAQYGLASSLEAAGKYEEAIKEYSAFTGDNASSEAVRANWDIGRCYQMLGEKDKAREYYAKAVEYGADSLWAQLARRQLISLTRGPVEPAAEEPPVTEPQDSTDEAATPPPEGESAPEGQTPPSEAPPATVE